MSDVSAAQALDDGLTKLAQDYTLTLPADARAKLLQLIDLLLKWNKVYNLISRSSEVDIVQRHVLDSLVLSHWLPARQSCRSASDQSMRRQAVSRATEQSDVIDIGSGAGFPVLPLAIVRPDLRFISVEANGKKTRFQQQVQLDLKLVNVDIRNERVEHVTAKADFVTSRAFAAPESFLPVAQALCSPDARIAIMLGQAERMPARLPEGFELEQLEPVHIPGVRGQRHVAICRSK